MTRSAVVGVAIFLLVIWDVAAAGRLAQRRSAPRAFRLLSGLCGFLVLPAVLISIGARSALTGRALEGLGWLWPAVLMLFSCQAAISMYSRLASRWIAGPILALNVVLTIAAAARYIASMGVGIPTIAFAPGLAIADIAAWATGEWSFASPFVTLVPLLAPGRAVDSTVAGATRVIIAVAAGLLAMSVAVESVRASTGLQAYALLGTERATEIVAARQRENLVVGLGILPALGRVPSARLMRDDLTLADSLAVGALLVRIAPDGCTPAVLDSLDRALESFRADSGLLIVELTTSLSSLAELRASEAEYVRHRVGDVDRVVRRLRPDYLISADGRNARDGNATDRPNNAWERRFLTATALAAHRARPETKAMVVVTAAASADSELFAWATAAGSPVDATAFDLAPAPGGANHVRAALASVDRWIRRVGGSREHWLFVAGTPELEGEDAQRRLARHTLLWAAAHPGVRGVVLADAADYDRVTGFRAPNGRLRPVTGDVAATIRVLSEPSAPIP